jgi:DNA-binding transcriptional ArsR family regulator
MSPARKAAPSPAVPTLAERAATAERRPATDEEARALASTLRMRILRVCLHEAHTNNEIAGILGKDPATTLHHVRRLVDTGFLEALPVRRGTRGSREIPYLATGKSWHLSTPAKDRVLVDAFLEEMALVPARQLETARLGLRMTEQTRDEFLEKLGALWEEYRAKSDDEQTGPAWSLFFAMHPDPNYPDLT